MSPRRSLSTALLLLATISLLGCGTDDTDPKDAGVTEDTAVDSAEDAEPDTADVADGTSDTEEDTEGQDAGPSTEMPQFEYRSFNSTGCSSGGGCYDGVEVNVTSNQITKLSPSLDNNPVTTMTDADSSMLIEQVLTPATVDKMRNSWDCGTSDPPDDIVHEFEGRIGTDISPTRSIKDVTGCINDDSAPDATRVQEIRTILMDLRTKYFDD
jgi:hypothetical protein